MKYIVNECLICLSICAYCRLRCFFFSSGRSHSWDDVDAENILENKPREHGEALRSWELTQSLPKEIRTLSTEQSFSPKVSSDAANSHIGEDTVRMMPVSGSISKESTLHSSDPRSRPGRRP